MTISVNIKLAFTALVLILFSPFHMAFASDTQIADISKSGIKYPDGFDINTVGEIKGTVSAVHKPEAGPVQILLVSRYDTYVVLVSPKWYLEDIGLDIKEGTELTVKGSKSLGKDGNLYLLAKELTVMPSNKSFVFRTERGVPMWSAGAFRGSGSAVKRGDGGLRGGGSGHGRR